MIDGIAVVVGVSQSPQYDCVRALTFSHSGSGIGAETAFCFAEAGARAVIFADINEQSAKDMAEESKSYATHNGYRALAIKVDVLNEESLKTMVETVVQDFGRIDYSVHCAGVGFF